MHSAPFWQGSTEHGSGAQPVMVSGFGKRPGWQEQIGLPVSASTVQIVPIGPQGLGVQGSGVSADNTVSTKIFKD